MHKQLQKIKLAIDMIANQQPDEMLTTEEVTEIMKELQKQNRLKSSKFMKSSMIELKSSYISDE